jgi:hypothetical protein
LQQYYFYLNDNFATLIAKCTTDDQRNHVKNEFVIARDAYLKAENELLVEHDGILASLTTQLGDLQKEIEAAVSAAQDFTKVLQVIAAATGVAAKIVTAAT